MSAIDIGAAIYIAVKPIFKIYTIILVGFLLAKFNIVTMETARGISNMVVNAILPCLTFNKIVSNISWKDIKEIGVIVLSALILFSVGTVCAVITNYTTPVPKKWFWGLISVGIFPNISDLPIAYVQSMSNGAIFTEDEANKGVAYTCIFLFTQSFLMMNFGLWRLIGLDFRDRIHKPLNNQYETTDLEDCSKNNDVNEHIEDNHNSNIREQKKATNPCTDDIVNDNLFSKATLDTTKPMYVDPDTNTEHEMSSISSNALESVGNLESNLNIKPFNDEERETNNSLQFDYIKPFQNDVNNRNSRERSGSTSFRIHPESLHMLSSPSILENNNTDNIQRQLSHKSYQSSYDEIKRLNRKHSMNEMIAEYSAVTKIRSGQINLSHPLKLTEDVGTNNSMLANILSDSASDEIITIDNDTLDSDKGYVSRTCTITSTATSTHRKTKQFIKKYHLEWLIYFGINFIRPASLGALLGIIVALIPWVKACFVDTYVHVHKAPDGEPVLNFFMDFTGYIGNACVPLGLLLLSGTLARLQINSLPKGFIKSAILMTLFRLVVIPIIGIAWANKIYKLDWLDSRISKFVMILTWSMPSATSQVYFTAFYTPLEGEHIQMDCLSIFFIIQYSILFITLSIVVTYTLKIELHV